MCRVTRHHTRKHHISTRTEELEAKLGIHDIRHYVHSRVLRYLVVLLLTKGTSFVWTQTGLHLFCSAVGWWMASSLQVKPRSFTIPLYKSCLTRWGSASLMPLASNKSEWHNITRPEALAAPARAASGFSAKLPPNGPLLPPKGLHHPHHEQLAPR